MYLMYLFKGAKRKSKVLLCHGTNVYFTLVNEIKWIHSLFVMGFANSNLGLLELM